MTMVRNKTDIADHNSAATNPHFDKEALINSLKPEARAQIAHPPVAVCCLPTHAKGLYLAETVMRTGKVSQTSPHSVARRSSSFRKNGSSFIIFHSGTCFQKFAVSGTPTHQKQKAEKCFVSHF